MTEESANKAEGQMAATEQVKEDMTDELVLQILMRINTSLSSRSDARFTYLIGNNGAGKSRLLATLAEHLAGSRLKPHAVCVSSSLYDRFEIRYPRTNVKYLGARNPENAVFHSRVDRSLSQMILDAMHRRRTELYRLERVLNTSFFMSLDFPTDRKGDLNLLGLVDRRKVRGRALNQVFSAVEQRLLKKMAGTTFSFRSLNERQVALLRKLMNLNGIHDLWVRPPAGNVYKFRDLSSGEQNRALIFAKVLSVAQDGIAILIDEPEISLHLQWQWDFHEKLTQLLAPLKYVHVVIATHAPVVVSEAAKADSRSTSNVVVVLDRETPPRSGKRFWLDGRNMMTYKQHGFAEVASHERLVLKYFETVPYNSQAVSMEVADGLLDAADATRTVEDVIASLEALFKNKGMDGDPKASVAAAVELLKDGVIGKLAQEKADEIPVH